MAVVKREQMSIRSAQDIVKVRQVVRTRTIEMGFSLVDQTKLVTAASELARNTLDYGGGGTLHLEWLNERNRPGLRLTFADHGPGIPDVALALQDGYSSGSGMGLGLSGAKRLSHEFTLASKVGEGTQVTITRWK